MKRTTFIKAKTFFEEDFIEKIAEVPVDKIKPWDENTTLNVVGKGLPRIDGYDKVSGTAKYTFDITLPRLAHALTLRSIHPHAHISNIDITKAEALPGVLHIISYKNTPEISWYGNSYLFDPHVRYAGDEIACVAAETQAIAEKALSLIKVEYDRLPFVASAAEALKDNSAKVFESGNIVGGKPSTYNRGDVEKAFAEADVVIEETYQTQVVIHNPTEVHCSVVNWDGDYLEVYDSTQALFGVRDGVAEALNLPASHVRVIKKYMGGGFGSKLTTGKYTVMAAILARKIGRPVKITLDRREMNLAVGNRPDSVQKLKFAAKKDGTLTAMSHSSYGAAGAYPSGAGCSWPLRTIYKCENVNVEEYTAFINAGPGRPFRAPGHVQGIFGLESAIDQIAEKIGLDPLEFRMKNYAENDQVFNLPYTSKKLMEAYQAGSKAIGWERRNNLPGSSKGKIKRGIGMASQIWWGGGSPPASANLKLNRDGSVQILAGTQDLGTGTYTILAQIASEVLEIPMAKIHVLLGDTFTTPYCPASGGSTTAPSVSPAVRDAAEQMKAKLLSAASAMLNTAVKELIYKEGAIKSKTGEKILTIDAILRETGERMFLTTGMREANLDGYTINSFGAQFADVEVDTVTGKIRVKRIVAAHDVGRVLNRTLLENQFHGGIMQGLSFALMEERVLDQNTGHVTNTNMHDYKMPLITDTPEIEVIIVSGGDPKISNTGVKGIGEPAIIPTAGAIANAVYNAIGVRLKELPMTPDRVLNALNS